MTELIYLFLLGIVIGSFLNVCIYRIPRGGSVNFPPSHCPICKEKIKWYDNVPILSYLFLRGKCRVCKSKISIQYPLIEFFTGLLYMLVYLKFGWSILTLKFLIFVSLLIVLSIIDLKSYYLPDSLTFSLISLGIIFSWFSGVGLEQSYIGAGTYAFPFVIIYGFGEYIFKKEAMGFGDIKLACGIGAFFGYNSFYNMYIWFTLSFVIGSIISLILIALKIRERKNLIPFAPFMGISALITMFLYL